MAINFKKIAMRNTVLSTIMENRDKVEKGDGTYHIEDFDIIAGKSGEAYAICAINSTQFINGGFVLTRIFTDIVNEYGGDIERARSDFRAGGGLDVELKREKTAANRDIVTVKII